MKKITFNRQEILDKAYGWLVVLRRYSLTLFIVFVVCLYGFLLFRVNSLSNAQPLAADVAKQVNAAAIPHIDQAVVKQLQSLQDNSVTVHSLFDQARSNPFQ